jgi:hypothetical protein
VAAQAEQSCQFSDIIFTDIHGAFKHVTIGIADVVLCGIRTCTRKGIKLPTIGKFLFNADSCIFCLCNKCFHACFVQDPPSDLAS